MSPRWKYQIRNGMLFASVMTLSFALMNILTGDKSVAEELSSPQFYVRAGIMTILGIFFVGYFNWREKEKENKKTT